MLGTVLALVGTVMTYVKVELAEPGAFADRGVAALQSQEVRKVIAEELAVKLLEEQSPDLVATRPLVLAAVEAILGTDEFERVLRRSAITARGVLLRGDEDVTVELAEVRKVLGPALENASPALARRLPADLRPEIAQIRQSDAAAWIVRVAESARLSAYPLLAIAFLCLGAAVRFAPDRRQAFGLAGLTVAGGMAVGVALWSALREQVLSHTGAIGVLSEDDAQDAAGAAFDALAADLRRAMVIVGITGVAVWGGSLLSKARVDREELLDDITDVLVGGSLPAPARALRGLVVAVVGGLVLLGAHPVFEVVVAAFAGALVLLGLTEILTVTARPRQATGVRPRGPRRRSVLAGGAAAAVAAVVVLAVVLRPDGTPAPLESDEIRACNGQARLCDRRLDQVVFPATHNSMSAAQRPGWFFANQQRPIPRQLDDGIRWLMIDPHYGISDETGRVRTDLRAEGTNRNRVANELGSDAVRAAENLAGRVGLVPSDGKRGIFLCHSLCELGFERFGATLGEIRGFLERNRAEVVVLMLESSVAPEEIVDAFEDAGLEGYLATLPRNRPMPTLRSLITSGRRLVVLDEGDGGGAPWFQPAFVLAQNTSIGRFTQDTGSCTAGRGTPSQPLLIMNHWVDTFPPSPRAAAKVNRASVVERRVRRCEQVLGRRPNVVALDFYDRGDLFAAVRDLNRQLRTTAVPKKQSANTQDPRAKP